MIMIQYVAANYHLIVNMFCNEDSCNVAIHLHKNDCFFGNANAIEIAFQSTHALKSKKKIETN